MTVTIKLFAILRDQAGISESTLQVHPGNTVGDAAQLLAHKYPDISSCYQRIAYAVNEHYVPATTELHDGDELALIPPVSGG